MNFEFDKDTGLPLDDSYLESDLPPSLVEVIEEMKKSWAIIDNGGKDLYWDCTYCWLQSEINMYAAESVITDEQAWHLRKKYLRMESEDIC